VGPNVLLVVFDTARADAVEPYGARPGATPTLAQMASAGTAAPSVFSTANWTVPAHGSMFTGMLPGTSGLGRSFDKNPQGFKRTVESHRERLLSTVLGRSGYATSGVSANLWVSSETGFDTGFDSFTFVRAARSTGHAAGTSTGRLHADLQAVRARVDDGAAEIERLLGDWLTQRSDQPFFWFVNLVECHSPYLPPKPYNDLPPWQRLLAGEEARRHLTLDAIWRTCLGPFDVSEPALRRMRHLYGRAIKLMDDWLARVLDALDRHGLVDETLVIVTSDHGENFGENGLFNHAFSLDDRLIRVPLVAAGPESHRFTDMRSLVSIPRLIGDAIGLREHPWELDSAVEEVAVAQHDAPFEPGVSAVADTVARWGLDDTAAARFVASHACATDGSLKLLRHARGEEEVVDLSADPLEVAPSPVDVSADSSHDVQIERLRAALDRADATKVTPPRADNLTEKDASANEISDLEDRMRLLGYL
jgi:hypothetical protein